MIELSGDTTEPFLVFEVPEGTAVVGISRAVDAKVIVMSIVDEPQSRHAGICLGPLQALTLYHELGLLIHSITESPHGST